MRCGGSGARAGGCAGGGAAVMSKISFLKKDFLERKSLSFKILDFWAKKIYGIPFFLGGNRGVDFGRKSEIS